LSAKADAATVGAVAAKAGQSQSKCVKPQTKKMKNSFKSYEPFAPFRGHSVIVNPPWLVVTGGLAVPTCPAKAAAATVEAASARAGQSQSNHAPGQADRQIVCK
jgi:hypothetical protein